MRIEIHSNWILFILLLPSIMYETQAGSYPIFKYIIIIIEYRCEQNIYSDFVTIKKPNCSPFILPNKSIKVMHFCHVFLTHWLQNTQKGTILPTKIYITCIFAIYLFYFMDNIYYVDSKYQIDSKITKHIGIYLYIAYYSINLKVTPISLNV